MTCHEVDKSPSRPGVFLLAMGPGTGRHTPVLAASQKNTFPLGKTPFFPAVADQEGLRLDLTFTSIFSGLPSKPSTSRMRCSR